jgi:diguanylate cyclase (GGDEF)-like protein/putative nucleotidyltransferase with HDIG domain
MSLKTKLYLAFILLLGTGIVASELSHWSSADLTRFWCFFAVALCASGLKVTLPAVTGTMSVNFLFILFGVVEFTASETLTMACVITAAQCLWHAKRRPQPVQVLFNVAGVAIATMAGYRTFHFTGLERFHHVDEAVMLLIAAVVFFAANTLPVAIIIALTESKSIRTVWSDCYFWSFPYYLVGAVIAGVMSFANRQYSWQTSLVILPVAYLIYRSYGLYMGRLEDEKAHAEQMAALHLRTIEALALAIEAKDHTTHDHLERVQVYALEIGRELGLSRDELEALRAAALLHDIGKLAVPEHIISKPGKLTPEEFEKMKIHPVVGAEILERVQFPYPVAPVVRSHHERWDGSGYPDGLKGEDIPIGARILSAVDCLDALASDRQYRRALPLEEALQRVVDEAGKAFDPSVVAVLKRRYRELEGMAKSSQSAARTQREIRIPGGHAPATGFESTESAAPRLQMRFDFLESIAAARQEVQALFELAQDLGNSLSLDETLSVLAVRLRRMIPCDAMAIYIKRDRVLIPEYVVGDDFRLFSSLEIPIGEGLSGWVAENVRPIINGNPSVEPAYLNDPNKFSKLRSALAVPLEGITGVLGVLALYQAEKDAFTKDHLRVLLAICSKVALSVENALRYRQAESTATTDFLTNLPNARSLFLHLDSELARCRRMNTPLAVLVCDLDDFKMVNDRFGHLEGNKLLHAVAQGLKESCREYDYVARMGGDEFVLVLPGATPAAIEAHISRLRSVTARAGREICGADWLDVSIGQAFFPEDGADAESLLAEADRRMYKEKQRQKSQYSSPSAVWDADLSIARVQ